MLGFGGREVLYLVVGLLAGESVGLGGPLYLVGMIPKARTALWWRGTDCQLNLGSRNLGSAWLMVGLAILSFKSWWG
jgi:hypothetical protein